MLTDLVRPKSSILTKVQLFIMTLSPNLHDCGMEHLRTLLFDSCVHDKWSFEQLPLVQRIMNTVEKTSTGVSSTELIRSHSIRLIVIVLSQVIHLFPIGWVNGYHDNIHFW